MNLPYGRQSIDRSDIDAVVEALTSDWLTTGPRVTQFEADIAAVAGAPATSARSASNLSTRGPVVSQSLPSAATTASTSEESIDCRP